MMAKEPSMYTNIVYSIDKPLSQKVFRGDIYTLRGDDDEMMMTDDMNHYKKRVHLG